MQKNGIYLHDNLYELPEIAAIVPTENLML